MAGTAALPCSPLSVDVSRALAVANVVLLGAGQDNSGGEEEQGGHRSLAKLCKARTLARDNHHLPRHGGQQPQL